MDWNKLLWTGQGRIGRRSYWLFILGYLGVALVAGVIDGLLMGWSEGTGPVSAIVSLAGTVPQIFVTTKRLHDTGRSGWMQLMPLGVLLGALVVGGFASLTGRENPLFIVVAAVLGLAVLAAFVLLIAWVGFFKSDPGANRFGEPDSGDRQVTPVAEVFS